MKGAWDYILVYYQVATADRHLFALWIAARS